MRENAGYTIIAAVPVNEIEEAVIGRQETEFGTDYVCWYYHIYNNEYYWGIYTRTYEKALSALFKRVREYYRLEV